MHYTKFIPKEPIKFCQGPKFGSGTTVWTILKSSFPDAQLQSIHLVHYRDTVLSFSKVIPINPITRNLWTSNGYNANLTSAKYELVFLPANTPPLGWSTYFFKRVQSKEFNTRTILAQITRKHI